MKFTIFALLFALPSVQASISNYPPEYVYQKVHVLHQGSALFGYVGSGILSTMVLGYKKSGSLASTAPDFIDAVVTADCPKPDGSWARKTSVVRMGKEWNGTGYMSSELDYYHFMSGGCGYQQLEQLHLAFSDGKGHWDSHEGQNYLLIWNQLVNSPVSFATQEGGSTINPRAWSFIIDEMKK